MDDTVVIVVEEWVVWLLFILVLLNLCLDFVKKKLDRDIAKLDCELAKEQRDANNNS